MGYKTAVGELVCFLEFHLELRWRFTQIHFRMFYGDKYWETLCGFMSKEPQPAAVGNSFRKFRALSNANLPQTAVLRDVRSSLSNECLLSQGVLEPGLSRADQLHHFLTRPTRPADLRGLVRNLSGRVWSVSFRARLVFLWIRQSARKNSSLDLLLQSRRPSG